MNIVQRVCLIVADAVIVVVTIYHTYGTMKISREANIQATFSRTLLRAGQSTVRLGMHLDTDDWLYQAYSILDTCNCGIPVTGGTYDTLGRVMFVMNIAEFIVQLAEGFDVSSLQFIVDELQ